MGRKKQSVAEIKQTKAVAVPQSSCLQSRLSCTLMMCVFAIRSLNSGSTCKAVSVRHSEIE